MWFPLGTAFTVGALMAVTAAGITTPGNTAPAGWAAGLPTAAGVVPLAASGAASTVTSSRRVRLEVWTAPTRIAKIKRGRSRTITAQAVETMAEWRAMKAVITARTTAGRITPRRTQATPAHPARFRLARTPGSSFGFVTFTAITRHYGTATRIVSWGPVPLSRTLTGTLAHVEHLDTWEVSDTRESWNVTFRLVSRSWRGWMGAAKYELSSGTWKAVHSSSSPDDACSGQGNGRAAAGTLRYDWRGMTSSASSGAGDYWIDVTGTDEYFVSCSSGALSSGPAAPFTFGFQPATGGVHPDHLKGSLTKRLRTGDHTYGYETWTWNLSGP